MRVKISLPTLDENFPYKEVGDILIMAKTYNAPDLLVELLRRQQYIGKRQNVYTKYDGRNSVQVFEKKTNIEVLQVKTVPQNTIFDSMDYQGKGVFMGAKV